MKLNNFITLGIGSGYFIIFILSIKYPIIINDKFMYFISVASLMFALAELQRNIVSGMKKLADFINKNKKVLLINYEKYIKFINKIKKYQNIYYRLFIIIGFILILIWPFIKLKTGNYTESANTVTILSFSLFFLACNLEILFNKIIKSFQSDITKSKRNKKKFEKELLENLQKVFGKDLEEEILKEKVIELANEVEEVLKNELSDEKIKKIFDKKLNDLGTEKN